MVDMAAGLDLRIVAYATQQAVGDTRGAACAAGDLACAFGAAINAEDAGRTPHDAGQLFGRIELQALHDAEAVAQRRGQQAGAGGCTNQRKRRQIELDRTCGRAVADHDVDLEVFHRRIQHFLDHGREAMDFVDEQHVVRLQVGQQRRQITGLFDHRAGGHPQAYPQLVGDDMTECGLAQARRAEDQDVVQRFAP
ncbi:hypothetical protein D3C71_1273230 [compost metagenome]